MPPARRSPTLPPALTDTDVADLRERVAGGETPRVVVRVASASVPAGTRGGVVRVGSPSDNEYITVRLGRDEVPYAPSELGLPGRKAPSAPRPRPTKSSRSSRSSGAPAKRVPPMVVTLRFRDGGWTVEAQRGAKRLCKPSPLRPGAVSALSEHLDDDDVRDALVETVEACRAVVEEQAAALRAELERAEAALRAYDARPARAKRT
jgi:hypothetical protein